MPTNNHYLEYTIAALCRALEFDLALAGLIPFPADSNERANCEHRLDHWIWVALIYAGGVK